MPAQTFDQRCGIHTPQRELALQQALQKMLEHALREVRFVWCDIHGTTRSKTLMPDAVEGASLEASERLIPFVAAFVVDVSLAQRLITVDWGLDF